MLESWSRSALAYTFVEKVSERDHQIVMFRIWLPCSAILRWRRDRRALVDQKDPNGFRTLHHGQSSTHIQKIKEIHILSSSLDMVLGRTPLVGQFLQRLASRLSFWWPELEKGWKRMKKAHIPNLQTGKKWKAVNALRAKHFRVGAVLFFCLEAWDILLAEVWQEQARIQKVDRKADPSQRFIQIQH